MQNRSQIPSATTSPLLLLRLCLGFENKNLVSYRLSRILTIWPISKHLNDILQGCPTGGPRAASGSRLPSRERCSLTCVFSAIFCLLCVVNKLNICWTQQVVCKTTLPQLSVNIAVINHSFSKTLVLPTVGPIFYGNGVIPCQNVDTVR